MAYSKTIDAISVPAHDITSDVPCSAYSNIIQGDKPVSNDISKDNRKHSSLKVTINVQLEGYTPVVGDIPSSELIASTPSSGFQILPNGILNFITRNYTKPTFKEYAFGFKKSIPGHAEYTFRQYTPKTIIDSCFKNGISDAPFNVNVNLTDDELILNEELEFKVQFPTGSVNYHEFKTVVSFIVDV